MAEDTRLKHSTENFNIESQSDNQSNQPQHPHQTIHTEKLLKETSTNNNIEYTIMERYDQIVLDYILSSEMGEILKRNGQELKKLKIGEKTYNFERNNPITKVNDILKIFLHEYVEELFNGYEKYLNIEEIKEYLQKVVNT